MDITTYISNVKTAPDSLGFHALMALIESQYDFTPTEFSNGTVVNLADQNQGSCKLFSFAKLNNLNKEETLACFGKFYRDDVLQNPQGDDHQNIRNFMTHGWDGVSFKGKALTPKS